MNDEQRKPLRERNVKSMTPSHGNSAKKGYATYKPTIYDKRCKFCQGSGVVWSVVSRGYNPCPGCRE